MADRNKPDTFSDDSSNERDYEDEDYDDDDVEPHQEEDDWYDGPEGPSHNSSSEKPTYPSSYREAMGDDEWGDEDEDEDEKKEDDDERDEEQLEEEYGGNVEPEPPQPDTSPQTDEPPTKRHK